MTDTPPATSVVQVAAAAPGREGEATAPTHRGRVPAIDGLRAVAAMWVVLFHIHAFSGAHLPPGLEFIARAGSTGVSLFLVLSGLCLYLPYAGGRQSRFRMADFFRRRVRRLLPAYYASLGVILALHVVADGRWGLPRLTASDFWFQAGTHATLTHQLFPTTFYGLNGAYWSLGLEWELYLTLPLLVLAAVRFGLARTVGVVLAVTATYRLGLFAAGATGLINPHGTWAEVVLPNVFLGRWSEFALGMVAAEWFRTRGTRVSWAQLVASAGALALALALPDNPLNHMLYGLVFFTLVCLALAGGNVVARIFSWRPIVAIGVMSYSLYLVHQPIVEMLSYGLSTLPGASPERVFLLDVLLFPGLLIVALVLFVTVERRSLAPRGARPPSLRQLMLDETVDGRQALRIRRPAEAEPKPVVTVPETPVETTHAAMAENTTVAVPDQALQPTRTRGPVGHQRREEAGPEPDVRGAV